MFCYNRTLANLYDRFLVKHFVEYCDKCPQLKLYGFYITTAESASTDWARKSVKPILQTLLTCTHTIRRFSQAHTHSLTSAHTHVHVQIHAHTNARMHARTHARTRTYTQRWFTSPHIGNLLYMLQLNTTAPIARIIFKFYIACCQVSFK